MSSLSLRLPDSLHRKIRELAAQDDISINQFIATAVAEKAAALLTVEYLAERGRRADPSSWIGCSARMFRRCTATNCPRHQASLTRRCSRLVAGSEGLRAGGLVRLAAARQGR